MNQKLTLSIDQDAISRGKRYAKAHGKSLSSLVEEFLIFLDSNDEITAEIPISSKLSSLVGIGAGPVDEEDYRRHLLEKSDV